jgi:DNA-binding IclR family transcriptional regulator
MRPASVQRIENLQRLIAALAERSMGPGAVAELLEVSDRAARNYLKALEDAGLADQVPGCRTRLRLRPDATASARFPLAPHACPVRRDPLVAALFGAGTGVSGHE